MRREGGAGESNITFIVRDGTWTISCDVSTTVWLNLIILILPTRELGIRGGKQLD